MVIGLLSDVSGIGQGAAQRWKFQNMGCRGGRGRGARVHGGRGSRSLGSADLSLLHGLRVT